MKKLLVIILIICLTATTVLASEGVNSQYIDTVINYMNKEVEIWDKDTVLNLIKAIVEDGFITEEDIVNEIEGVTTEQVEVFSPMSVDPTTEYASLEIIPRYGYAMTEAGGHIYSFDIEYDDTEENWTYLLERDDEVISRIDDYWGPRGIVQLNGVIYVARANSIYKYSNGDFTMLTDNITGYIRRMAANGNDLYILCNNSPDRDGSYLEGDYYKVSTSGEVTKLEGMTVAVDFTYPDFAVNKDGDRLANIPFLDSGTVIRNLSTGSEYFQRDNEEKEPHAQDEKIMYSDEYSVISTLYYNNCLIVNVKGSLVYYDEKNRPHVILGNMKGNRVWREGYIDSPADLWPIQTGLGNEVALGYVSHWSIGEDGYIYGVTMEDWDIYHSFRIALPDSVKDTITYKKK